MTVASKFCVVFGKEVQPDQKRERSENTKLFYHPFRAENFRSHMKTSHSERYSVFSMLGSFEEKKKFFSQKAPFRETLTAHFDSHEPLVFTF